MAETKYGSLISNGYMNTYPPEKADGRVLGGRLHHMVDTVEVTAAAAATSKYFLGKVPSDAIVITALSSIRWDDLDGSVNSPTLDIGIQGPTTTANDTALSNGNAATAAGSVAIGASNIANYGQQFWQVCGLSADPQELLDIYVTIQDFAVDTGGTITATIVYVTK